MVWSHACNTDIQCWSVILHNTGDMLRLHECKVLGVCSVCVCLLFVLLCMYTHSIGSYFSFNDPCLSHVSEQEEKEEEEESDLGESRIP